MAHPRNRFRGREKNRTILYGEARRMPSSPEDHNHGIIGLRLEYDYKDDPAQLGKRLAECHRAVEAKNNDAVAYRQQAMDERRKEAELRDVLSQIERDPSRESLVVRHPETGQQRRMNPYKEYSVDAIVEQLGSHQGAALDFDAKAEEALKEMAEYRQEIGDIEKVLNDLRG